MDPKWKAWFASNIVNTVVATVEEWNLSSVYARRYRTLTGKRRSIPYTTDRDTAEYGRRFRSE